MHKIKKIYIIIPVIILTIILIAFGIVNIVNASKQANAEIENNKFANEEGQADQDKVLDGQEDIIVVPMDDETLDNAQEVPEETEPEQEQKEEPKVQQTTQTTAKPSTTVQQKKDIKYFIRVNYNQNVVTIYTKDSNGNYTVPYKAMVCSTGKATPRSGTYTIPSGSYSRATWGLMVGNVWAQYFTRIKGSILFHSVPYTQRNKWSLEYWEYDKLGTTASAGCIRLTVQDAKWIYDNCPSGTQVEFYSDSNPGPLGKPTAQKISSEEAVRGWDPTDPAGNNPWKTYRKEETKVEQITPETPKEEIKTEPIPETPKEEIIPEKPEEPKQEIKPTNPEGSEQEKETESEKPETKPSETTKPEDTSKEETTKPSETTKPEDASKEGTTKPTETAKPEDTSKEETTKPSETTKPEDTSKEEITKPSEITKPEDTSKEETTKPSEIID